jgi:hypothetical protein
MQRSPIVPLLLGLAATVAHGQQSARIVKYHANDIVSVRAKMRYTTLIQLPATEKILEVATGDKDFWIIDTVGNYCFLHPAKEGIHSNLNLITDKCSMPICFEDCSTIDQTAQSLSVSRLIFPLFEIDRSSRPSSMPAAVIQALIPCLTQIGRRRCGCAAPCPRGRPAPICLLIAGWSLRRVRPARSA